MPRLKILVYYGLLLLMIVLVAAYLAWEPMNKMSMPAMISICTLLVFYSILVSLVGEIKCEDEREVLHRNLSNRLAMIMVTVFISLGLIYQIFIGHRVDWWLLASIIIINLTKIVSLIYFHYKK